MRLKPLILFTLLLCSVSALAGKITTDDECTDKDTLREVFGKLLNDPKGRNLALEFMKIQTSITHHRVGWAHLKHLQKNNKQTSFDGKKDVVEKGILELIKAHEIKIGHKVAEKYGTKYISVRDKFNDYVKSVNANRTSNRIVAKSSREDLADISPILKDAIKSQLKQSESDDLIYHLNAADIATLNLLKARENKMFKHDSAWKDHRGIVNILREINAALSLGNVKPDIDKNLIIFENYLAKQNAKLDQVLNDLLGTVELPPICKTAKLCGKSETSLNTENLKDLILHCDDISGVLQQSILDKTKSDESFEKALYDKLNLCKHRLHLYGTCLDEKLQDPNCPQCKCTSKAEPVVPKKICDEKTEDTIIRNGEVICIPKKVKPIEILCPDGSKPIGFKVNGEPICKGDPKKKKCLDGSDPTSYKPNGDPICENKKPSKKCPEGQFEIGRHKNGEPICQKYPLTICAPGEIVVSVDSDGNQTCKKATPGSTSALAPIIINNNFVIMGGGSTTGNPIQLPFNPGIIPTLPQNIQQEIYRTIAAIQSNPYNPQLNNQQIQALTAKLNQLAPNLFPPYPGGGGFPPTNGPGGNNPGGDNPGGDNTDPNDSNKTSKLEYKLTLIHTVGILDNPGSFRALAIEGEDKSQYIRYFIKWEISDDKAFKLSDENSILFDSGTYEGPELPLRVTPYSYTIKGILYGVDVDGLKIELTTSNIITIRAFRSIGFSCSFAINAQFCEQLRPPMRPSFMWSGRTVY